MDDTLVHKLKLSTIKKKARREKGRWNMNNTRRKRKMCEKKGKREMKEGVSSDVGYPR